MNQYHEQIDLLSEETKNITRAIRSLIEEFEAVDWYNQRVNATKDAELREILAHNRDEELEHAVMTLEYLRRKLPMLDKELRDNLFKEGPITGDHAGGEDQPASTPLNVGSLK
mgnify:CR=1 FL=1